MKALQIEAEEEQESHEPKQPSAMSSTFIQGQRSLSCVGPRSSTSAPQDLQGNAKVEGEGEEGGEGEREGKGREGKGRK